jgi:hypothetical protein
MELHLLSICRVTEATWSKERQLAPDTLLFWQGLYDPPRANLAGAGAATGGEPHETNYWAKMILERGTGLEPATSCLEGTECPPNC